MRNLALSRWLVTFGLLLCAMPLATFASANDGVDQAENWLHFGYDDAYTACNPVESTIDVTNVTDLVRRWGIGCDDGYFSVVFRSPAIYNGTLYNSGAGDRLTAYNARNGRELWKFGNGNAAWAPQPVVSEEGVVFYMEETIPTYLYAVDSQRGTQIWKAPIGFDLGYQGAAGALVTVDEANGWLYLVAGRLPGDGQLYAVEAQTGQIAWYMDLNTHDADFSGNYALLDDGKLYAAAEVAMDVYPWVGDHALRIDPATQVIEETYERPAPENYWAIEAHTICNDTLIASFDYQYDPAKLVVGYDVASPGIAWQVEFGSPITGKIACNPDGNQIYVPSGSHLYALDAVTGDSVWTYTGYDDIYSPSLANGIVYFLSDTNTYALDEATGDPLFHYPLGYEAEETTQVAVAGGMLYFSGNGGTCDLFALGFPGEYQVFLPLVVRD